MTIIGICFSVFFVGYASTHPLTAQGWTITFMMMLLFPACGYFIDRVIQK